jgi:hypothetical protein
VPVGRERKVMKMLAIKFYLITPTTSFTVAIPEQ